MPIVEVVDHQPGGWFLLAEGRQHYLDINCALPLVSVDILLQLNADEEEELRVLGRIFTDYLAAKVSAWPHRYQPRDQSKTRAPDVTAAVDRWRAGTR